MRSLLIPSILGTCGRFCAGGLLVAATLSGCNTPRDNRPKGAMASTPGGGGRGPGEHGSQGSDADWVPSEFKKGQARWKDVGVYVDGVPVGMVTFGELPVALKPAWIEEEASIPLKPGHRGPLVKVIRQRAYKVTEYLTALGVDLAKVKELHVYGPRFTDSVIVGGDELRKRADEFRFRFGGEVRGKPIPIVPANFGNGRSPDKFTAILAYIDKAPPVLRRNEGLFLGDEIQEDIPYFGEPVRGGVRVYSDDRLATVIKRRELEDTGKDGAPLKLLDYLAKQGVDTSKVVEAWIIRGDVRVAKLEGAALAGAVFEVSAQAEGKVKVAGQAANALALHSRHISPDELPELLPDEGGGNVDWPKGQSN